MMRLLAARCVPFGPAARRSPLTAPPPASLSELISGLRQALCFSYIVGTFANVQCSMCPLLWHFSWDFCHYFEDTSVCSDVKLNVSECNFLWSLITSSIDNICQYCISRIKDLKFYVVWRDSKILICLLCRLCECLKIYTRLKFSFHHITPLDYHCKTSVSCVVKWRPPLAKSLKQTNKIRTRSHNTDTWI